MLGFLKLFSKFPLRINWTTFT